MMKVVLLPGLDGTGILFKPLTDILSKDIDIKVISYPTVYKVSYRGLVEFVMKQLPNEDFILVAESFSGPIAYEIALRKPKTIKSVIFTASFLENPRRHVLQLTRFLPMKLIFALPMPDFVVKHFFLGSSADEQLINLFRQSVRKVSPSVLSYRLKAIGKLSVIQKACDVNAIYIQASNDKLVPDSSVEIFKKMCKNLNIFRVQGTHCILQTNPLACAEIITDEVGLITNQSS
jgi:pimeloyl-ACP methyl ester carboxylesterase